MESSMAINIAYHVNDPNVGMPLTMDTANYKMYIGDTGLFVTMLFWDKKFTDNIIYRKLLSDKLEANLGYVFENVVAQMLRANGNRLFYHTFPSESKHVYEIDFLLSSGDKLCPVEVKSSGYKTHKSIDAFCEKYSSRISGKYILYTKDFHKESDVTYFPVYMTPLL